MTGMRALLSALLALAGCQGGSSADAVDLSAGSPCSGGLSGAVTETIVRCRVTWDEKSGVAEIGNDGDLVVSDPTRIDDSGGNFGFVFTVDGDAHPESLGYSNVTQAGAGVYVYSDGGANQYVASFSGNAPMAPRALGSLSADLTGVTVDFMTDTERQWIVHGSLTGTLVRAPPSTATDTVQLTLDF
jgi:hypothetical protein